MNAFTSSSVILDKLDGDLHIAKIKRLLHEGVIDLRVALRKIVLNENIASYMEIGVRRGYSMAMVAANSQCDITGIDLWISNYAGVPTLGPDFIRSQMQKVNHSGMLDLYNGDSKTIVPTLEGNYDLITVDGDHSTEGALADLRNCIERFNYALVFDDIDISPEVQDAWKIIQQEYPGFQYEEHDMVGIIKK